jgi:hypothetical protein
MNNIFGAISLLLMCLPGFLFNNLILGKKRAGESLALSWFSGSLVFSLILFVLNYYLGVQLSLTNCWLILFSLTTVLLIPNIKNFPGPEKIHLPKFTKPALILIIWLTISAFITSFFFPVADWDAVTVFDFRTKPLLEFGQIHNFLILPTISTYPLYTTLIHFWVYLNGLRTAMPIYPLFTATLVAGIYFAARRIMSSKVSLLLAIACLFAPKIYANTFVAYANLPYSVLLILGAAYIYLWTRERNYRDLILGILLSAATFWVRNFPFALVNFSLLFFAFPFFKKFSKYLVIFLTLVLVSFLFIPNFSTVANYLKWSVYEYYCPFWLIYAGLIIYNLIKKSPDWFWPLLYTGYGLIIFVGAYILTMQRPTYYVGIPDAVQRMTIFLNLVVIWSLAVTISDKKFGKYKN